MKGFMKDNKFHPISNYSSVNRKRREPFAVTRDGVKVSQKELMTMQRTPRKQRDEEPEEFELVDILEDVTGKDFITHEVNPIILEIKIKENVQEILEREKIWKKGDSVSLPVGSLQHIREETSREEFERTGTGESGFYQYDFDIINANNDITYHGTSFGDISAGDMIDMTIAVERA